MGLREDIQPYLHPEYRTVLIRPGEPNDNYHLFTAHYHNLIALLGEPVPLPDLLGYRTFLQMCEHPSFRGLFARDPNRFQDDISQDELIGIAWISFQYRFKKDFLTFAEQHDWCFNLKEPEQFDLRYWYARHPDVVPFLKACAGRSLSWLERIAWCGTVLAAAFTPKHETSGPLLRFIQFSVMWKRYWITDLAILVFLFMRSPKADLATYFGANHPLAVHCPVKIRLP